ncbi:MAG: hypothetical protein AAFV93_01920, partial [Chloroflexota bacterium]
MSARGIEGVGTVTPNNHPQQSYFMTYTIPQGVTITSSSANVYWVDAEFRVNGSVVIIGDDFSVNSVAVPSNFRDQDRTWSTGHGTSSNATYVRVL